MSIYDDAALRRLAKNLRQTGGGHYRRVYDVRQHPTRTHRGQLVRVAYQQKSRMTRQRPDERGHQRHVHHRDLIHYQHVAREWIGLTSFETAFARIGFEQTMDGLAL
jgi:hypothetical protein